MKYRLPDRFHTIDFKDLTFASALACFGDEKKQGTGNKAPPVLFKKDRQRSAFNFAFSNSSYCGMGKR